MKMHLKILLFSFAFAIMVGATVAQADSLKKIGFKEIVVFGESSSDTGNAYESQCPSPFEWGPWAPCTGAYFDGNLSNGRIWVEFLAKKLGLPLPGPSLLWGTNYAYAGAKTQRGPNKRISLLTGKPVSESEEPDGTEVPGILSQVDNYLADEKRFNKKDLVVIWGGANDLRDIEGPGDLTGILENLGEAITTVACSGAEHIMVPNQLNASVSPAVRISTDGDPEKIAQVEAAVRGFNMGLRIMVAGLQATLPMAEYGCESDAVLYYVDVFTAGEAVLDMSTSTGEPYANVTDPAVGYDLEIRDGVDPNDHLFLDPIHVTTPAQRIIANTAHHTLKQRIRNLRKIGKRK